jgi:response regulator of citrate/malate metabolism
MNDGQLSMEEVLASLRRIQDGLDQKVTDLRDELKAVQTEKASIDQMLHAAEKTGRYASRATKLKPKGVSQETVEKIWVLLASNDWEDAADDIPRSFTALGVAEKLGVTPTTARLSIERLREDGRVRLVGERKLGTTGRASHVYAVNG